MSPLSFVFLCFVIQQFTVDVGKTTSQQHLPNYPENLDPSYQMDLGFQDCFGRKNNIFSIFLLSDGSRFFFDIWKGKSSVS